ncbi:MAG: restriction endonuclease subunit S [Azonexus sp.]|jgi:type I restriction enzyme S subunit|nr:restriction endonuclease subunit S [Azonexus sp.]
MDAQQFLAEFGHIANVPGGVGKLRELVLSLAFKGELCPPSDEASNTLLDDIERQRLDFNGETRKQRLTRQSNATANSVGPYEIPKHWSWVGLSTVGHTWGQKKPDDSFVYIDVSSIDNKAGVLSQILEVISPSAAPSRARKIVKKGTLIYSTVRPYLLNIAIIDRYFDLEPIASTAFAIVHPWQGISGRYLYFYLRSPIFVRYVESVQIGMAYPAISDEKFYSGVVPLPPTEEQSRIVAKVEELMALCDTLEAQQQARRKLQNNLRQSTLQAVASATSPHELQATWARLADNFGRLFHAPEDVRQLRDVVFDLALRGVFLPDSKLSPSGDSTDAAFGPLPGGWEWRTLADLSEYTTSGSRGWKAYM